MHRFKQKNGAYQSGFNNPPPTEEFDVQQFRESVENQIRLFVASEHTVLNFPPMNRTRRKIVHFVAMRYPVETKSYGDEPNRYVCLNKKAKERKFSNIPETDPLILSEESKSCLSYFIEQNPISSKDVRDHLLEKVNKDYRNNTKSMQSVARVPPSPSNVSPDILRKRKELPSFKYKDRVMKAVEENNVIIISGGTGCGKTTQVPQFILEDAAQKNRKVRIMCTQPRRLAAISIAERVAKERGERVSDTVGYHIRLEQRTSEKTVLTYCTSGVLLRILSADPYASGITHIILDEIHERETNTDYLLIALKQAIQKRKDLKIVLMSATIEGNMHLFETYFTENSVNVIRIESRLFDVQRFFLADILALTGYVPNKSPFGFFAPIDDQADGFASMGYWQSENFEEKNAGNANENGEWISGCYETDDGDIIPEQSMNQFMAIMGESDVRPLVRNPTNSARTPFGAPPKSISNHNMNNGFSSFPGPSTQSSCFATNSASADPFGDRYRQEERLECQYRNDITNAIPTRCSFFCQQDVAKLQYCKSMRLDEKYKSLTGSEFDESIDVALVSETIKYLADSEIRGSILVFLPGYEDIMNVRDQILDWSTCLRNYEMVKVVCLHSQMNSADQNEAFKTVPRDVRKVILSTNIAEASITIEDVIFVVDTGKVKEKMFEHETKISHLKVTSIAKSNAEQRAGRAGRVDHGYCFRLYSERDYELMAETQVAEMRRSAIYEICLHARMFAPKRMRVADFLAMAPEPPSKDSIDQSMEFLQKLGALYSAKDDTMDNGEDPELTDLGKIMAQFPLDPQLARLLLFGLALKCLTPIVNLVALLSYRDPYVLTTSTDRTDMITKRDQFASCDFSDHLMYIRLVDEYVRAPNAIRFCNANYLNPSSMRMIVGVRRQLLSELVRARLLHVKGGDVMALLNDSQYNCNSDCWPIVQSAVVAGCYPWVGISGNGKIRNINTHACNNAILHPSSVVRRQAAAAKRKNAPQLQYFVFQEISKVDQGLSLRAVSVVPPISVLLFTGAIRLKSDVIQRFNIAYNPQSDYEQPPFENLENFEIEPWYSVRALPTDLKMILRLRFKFMQYFLRGLKHPHTFNNSDESSMDLLRTMRRVVTAELYRCGFQPASMPFSKSWKYNVDMEARTQQPRNIEEFDTFNQEFGVAAAASTRRGSVGGAFRQYRGVSPRGHHQPVAYGYYQQPASSSYSPNPYENQHQSNGGDGGYRAQIHRPRGMRGRRFTNNRKN